MPALLLSKTRFLMRSERVPSWPLLVAWASLGLAGSVIVLVSGAQLTRGNVRWWIDPRLAISGSADEIVLYVGMAALAIAWLGLGRHARRPLLAPRTLWVIGLLWAIPLLLSAPVFSRDVYSYFAQGTILHAGLNPYNDPPTVLAAGHAHVLAAVDPFWRHDTAPYGPLFLGVVSGIAAVAGSHVVLGAQLVKLLGLIGLALLGWFVPRLARSQGADPTLATWLAVLNPLVMLALLVPGHNDLLMVGLMVAGVAVAAQRWPLVGIAICTLAATIKLPAILAAAFIAVAWARSGSGRHEQITRLMQSAAVAVIALVVVSASAGVGPSWVTSSLFSTPARVHLAITPATGLAFTSYRLLGDVGVGANFLSIQSALRIVAIVLAVLVSLEALRRVRAPTLARYLGLALVAFALGGPAAWPWYFTWGFVVLAATPWREVYPWLILVMLAGAFVVKPDGILALSLQSSPYVVLCYLLLIGGGVWYSRRGQPLMPRPAPAES